jgi:hypothetical protein
MDKIMLVMSWLQKDHQWGRALCNKRVLKFLMQAFRS